MALGKKSFDCVECSNRRKCSSATEQKIKCTEHTLIRTQSAQMVNKFRSAAEVQNVHENGVASKERGRGGEGGTKAREGHHHGGGGL